MTDYFKELPDIAYEGENTDNDFAFRYYDAKRLVGDKTMAEHLRFAVSCWHTFMGTGQDIFGSGVYQRPWSEASDPMERAKDTIRAVFGFCQKLGLK